MSRLDPPALILDSMLRCSACSWLYVFPLNTDCTSVLTAVLMPSRRSPCFENKQRRNAFFFPRMKQSWRQRQTECRTSARTKWQFFIPGPLPEASSFLSLLISSSVIVVMSLQKSTFFPCSNSMYTYQDDNTHAVNPPHALFAVSYEQCVSNQCTLLLLSMWPDSNQDVSLVLRIIFQIRAILRQLGNIYDTVEENQTFMSSRRSSMSVTVRPFRKVYGSCISTARSSSSALMYFANRSMGLARPSRILILDLFKRHSRYLLRKSWRSLKVYLEVHKGLPSQHNQNPLWHEKQRRRRETEATCSNRWSKLTWVWPAADESCLPAPPRFWNVPPPSPSAASPTPSLSWPFLVPSPSAAVLPLSVNQYNLITTCYFSTKYHHLHSHHQ